MGYLAIGDRRSVRVSPHKGGSGPCLTRMWSFGGLSDVASETPEPAMNAVLVSAGVACVIAAVVGGGLKAFDIDLPVITSLRRQALLFVVGLGFLASAWLLRDTTKGSNEADTKYQALAAASCGRIVAIRTADLPFDVIDTSSGTLRFHKEGLLRELRRRQSSIQAELELLWTHGPPAALQPQQANARKVTAGWLSRVDDELHTLEATAPDPVTQADADVLQRASDLRLRAQANDAMTALAGQNCPAAG